MIAMTIVALAFALFKVLFPREINSVTDLVVNPLDSTDVDDPRRGFHQVERNAPM
jgi:hypothetical protein